MIYGISHEISLFCDLTLQNRKTLFCVFFTFRDLRELKRIWDFLRIIFSGIQGAGALEPPEGGPEAQTSPGGAVSPVGRATLARSLLKRP